MMLVKNMQKIKSKLENPNIVSIKIQKTELLDLGCNGLK